MLRPSMCYPSAVYCQWIVTAQHWYAWLSNADWVLCCPQESRAIMRQTSCMVAAGCSPRHLLSSRRSAPAHLLGKALQPDRAEIRRWMCVAQALQSRTVRMMIRWVSHLKRRDPTESVDSSQMPAVMIINFEDTLLEKTDTKKRIPQQTIRLANRQQMGSETL